MFVTPPQLSIQPHTGRVSLRWLTSSVKRSVLAMSMRFSYDARIRIAVNEVWSIANSWTTTNSTTPIASSVQEFRLTRNTPQNA